MKRAWWLMGCGAEREPSREPRGGGALDGVALTLRAAGIRTGVSKGGPEESAQRASGWGSWRRAGLVISRQSPLQARGSALSWLSATCLGIHHHSFLLSAN